MKQWPVGMGWALGRQKRKNRWAGAVNSRESVEGLGMLIRISHFTLGDGEPLKVSDSVVT